MKSMTKKIKEKNIKTPEEINNLIQEMENDSTNPTDLVATEYYSGNFFPIIKNYLPEDLELTRQEQATLAKGIKRKITGLSASIPIKCYGESCPFKDSCPLAKIDKIPTGQDCPIESMMMDLYIKRYLDEFDVHPDNFSEVTTMTQLAATHIMEMRGFMTLGRDDKSEAPSPDGLIKNVVGFNNDDEPIVQIQEHPAYNIIERAWRWRAKLLESLGATRKERLKQSNGTIEQGSLAQNVASLKSMIEQMTIEQM
jgi:hypothetical protein